MNMKSRERPKKEKRRLNTVFAKKEKEGPQIAKKIIELTILTSPSKLTNNANIYKFSLFILTEIQTIYFLFHPKVS